MTVSPARMKAVSWALEQLGAPVLMGYRGDLRFDRKLRTLMPHALGCLCWDCSGLMCGAVKTAGGKDMRGTHNAQLLHDGMRALLPGEGPLPGDGVFYGVPVVDRVSGMVTTPATANVIHVAIWTVGGKCISADGATWGIQSLEQARAARCQVRLHDTIHYRGDCPYVTVRRNLFLDELDAVTR
jgi:cell wall-associated NlpC family hydrolase